MTARDLKAFAAIGVDSQLLDRAGVRRVTSDEAADLGIRWKGDRAGIWFPRIDPVTRRVVGGRLRRDHPEIEAGTPKNKYLSTYGDRPHLYLSATPAALLDDVTVPVVLVEAEKSALMLAGLRDATVCPIGLGGCWGWRGTVGKAEDADGVRVDEKGPSPDFDRIAWQGRDAVVWLDVNVSTNPKVQAAERALVAELQRRGARVLLARVPSEWTAACPTINGPDDYYAADQDGSARVFATLVTARPADRVAPHQAVTDSPATSHDLVVLRASDIAPEAVNWLWEGRIALGTTTMIAGNPGLGKSQLACYLAAQTTCGGLTPEGSPIPAGDVAFLTAEDAFGSTLVPRLLAAGADLSRVHLIDCVRMAGQDGPHERGFDLVRDVPALDALLCRLASVRLVLIDPVTAYLGATDSHRTSDVRGVLRPLERLAQAHNVAVVLVSHLNKGGGAEAMTRVTGSLAFVAAARSAYLVVRDPQNDERRLLLTVKQNLAAEPEGLAFTVEGAVTHGRHGPISTSRIVWSTEAVTTTADEALAAQTAGGEDRSARDEAADWLRDALADGPRPRAELERQAKADGIAWRTVQRGAKAAGVRTVRAGFGVPAVWTLDAPSAPAGTHPRQPPGMAQMGADGADGAATPEHRPRKIIGIQRGESPSEEGATDVA